MSDHKPKIIIWVSVDWFFCSHFLERAVAAVRAGYDVTVITRIIHHEAIIRNSGIRLIDLDMQRRSLNPIENIKTIFRLTMIYRKEKPDIVHHVAIKPIILGFVAAKFSGIRNVVNAIVGLGFVFTADTGKPRLIRPMVDVLLRTSINPPGSKVIFENRDDLETFVEKGIVHRSDAILIQGAGVNPEDYFSAPKENAIPCVVMVARLLWDKGVREFVEAARRITANDVSARFIVAGAVDPDNPSSIDTKIIASWQEEGIVEFLGNRNDIPYILGHSDIACLPSYREGLPRALLEAMAAELPCVTTDVPGCREIVIDGENGILVPARDDLRLSEALETLLDDKALRLRMGKNGRQKILQRFSSEIVIRQTLSLYRSFLSP